MAKETFFKKKLYRTRNAIGIVVNQCCASCAFKELSRAVTLRHCAKTGEDVSPRGCCKLWTMSQQLKLAGRTQGRVKRKEYLMYLAAVREDEALAEQLGVKTTPKSCSQLRAEFERKHGSIYEPDFRPYDQEW